MSFVLSTYLYLFLLLRSVFTWHYLPFSGTGFRGPGFGYWISGTGFGNQGTEICSVYISLLWFSVFTWHYLPFSGTGFRGPDFGDRISGTGFRGPNFGDRISGTGFRNQEAKSNQFFLNFELCSVYISLLISTSTFCLHLTLPSFFGDRVSGTGFRVLDFGDRIWKSGNWDLFSLHISTLIFCLHLTLPSFFGDRVSGTGFWGLNFGDRISGTGFRGPDFGDRISGTGFRNQEAKSNQFFLNFELCSVYISLLVSTSTFCLHLTLPSFFGDRVSGTGFWGPNFGDRISGTEFRGPDFGDRISGTGFRRPDFGDRISGTGFRGPDFGIRKPSQTNSFQSLRFVLSSVFFSKLLVYSSVSTNGVSYFQE